MDAQVTAKQQAWKRQLNARPLPAGEMFDYAENDPDEDEGDEATLERMAQEAQEAETLEESQAIGRRMRGVAQSVSNNASRMVQDETARWLGKGAGNGTNAVGSVGWDGFMSFAGTFLYLWARAAVSILIPETKNEGSENTKDSVKAWIRTALPPYRGIKEPGDFGYFLFANVVAVGILTVILCILLINVILFAIPILIVLNIL